MEHPQGTQAMSEWYEAKEEDIDIDHEDKEVGFFVHSTDCGNV